MTYLTLITVVHTAISLAAIPIGAVAIAGLFRGAYDVWTKAFLVTAVATTFTGFIFPFRGVTPAFVTGIVATIVLIAVLLALFRYRVVGAWRWIYAAGMVVSLYLLMFVAVVQAFLKIEFINRFAPTQTEPPFLVAQLVTLLVFIALTVAAGLRYRPATLPGPVGAAEAQAVAP